MAAAAAVGGIRGLLDALDNFKLQLGSAADGRARPRRHAAEADPPAAGPVRGGLRRSRETWKKTARQFNPADAGRPVPPALAAASDRIHPDEGHQVREDNWAAVGRLGELDRGPVRRRLAWLRKERTCSRPPGRPAAKGQPEPDAETRRLARTGGRSRPWRVRAGRPGCTRRSPGLKEKGRLRKARSRPAAFRDVFNAFYQFVLEGRNERLARSPRRSGRSCRRYRSTGPIADSPLDDAYTAGIQSAL